MYQRVMMSVIPVFLLIPAMSFADGFEPATISITGTLVDGPYCEINDGHTIEVPFGRVSLGQVEAGNARREIPYDITCEDGDATGYTLTLSITGNPADFDSDNATVLSSTHPDLGVKVYANGAPFRLNNYINISIDEIPRLEAVLLQRVGSTLDEGDFSATATLRVIYQ